MSEHNESARDAAALVAGSLATSGARAAKASFILRLIYAVCLAGATCVHIAFHFQYGLFLEALAGDGYSAGTRAFWSSLSLVDPLTVALLFLHPRLGLQLTAVVIGFDVVHNTWILYSFQQGLNPAYCAQVAFLIFVIATIRTAWRGLPPAVATQTG